MSRLRASLRAAHRDAGEALLRKAVVHAEETQRVGGTREYGRSTGWEEALDCAILAVEHLRRSERRGGDT